MLMSKKVIVMEKSRAISLRERIRLNLVAAMENAGINQVQLADKLNISKGTVNNWTRGNNSPDVDMVPRICDVLGISVLSLYSPTELESPETPITKKSPAPAEASTGEISLEESNNLLIALGYIKPGEQISDDDLAFLEHVIGLLDAWFDKGH